MIWALLLARVYIRPIRENVYMPRKDEPVLTIRLTEGLDRQLQALAALRAVRKSTAARMLMAETVEQALGEESTEGSTSRPAPAGSPEEEYVPEWKKRTAYRRREVVPRPEGER